MPRLTPQHEQAVRQRIIDAAIQVFGESGYARASIQDVVRASGLSVGAVYTHFKGKEDLFLAACACEAEKQSETLRLQLAELGSLPDRLRAAVDWSIDMSVSGSNTKSALMHAWANPESLGLRELLRERQSEMVTFAQQILREAVERHELPDWIDVDGVANAFTTMINGFVMTASASGPMARDEVRRSAYALLELLLAAPGQAPEAVRDLRGTGVGSAAGAGR